MKKSLCILAAIFFCAEIFAASFKNGAQVYVSVKSASLRQTTGIFAKKTGLVSYGESCIVLQSKGKKTQIQLKNNPKIIGWISNGSLTSRKIVASASGSKVSASADEIALAGKGFSEEAENAYKAANKNLDFKTVDAIEKITVSEAELSNFAAEGKLNGGAE